MYNTLYNDLLVTHCTLERNPLTRFLKHIVFVIYQVTLVQIWLINNSVMFYLNGLVIH